MAWIPFDNRSPELQAAIKAKAAQIPEAGSAQAYYDANELGLVDEASLLARLEQDAVDGETPATPSEAEKQPPPPATIREEDLFSVKSLRWLLQNARTAEDKLAARDSYRQLLFDLWRKYLADTGETWYPPLQEDLWDHYKLLANDPDED